jgi:hypothetical protein
VEPVDGVGLLSGATSDSLRREVDEAARVLRDRLHDRGRALDREERPHEEHGGDAFQGCLQCLGFGEVSFDDFHACLPAGGVGVADEGAHGGASVQQL